MIWLPAFPSQTKDISSHLVRRATIQMWLSGITTKRKPSLDFQSMITQLPIWHFLMMMLFWFQQVTNLMAKCLSGTQLTVILFHHFKSHLRFSLMVLLLYAGEALSKTSSSEIPQAINSLFQDLRNSHFGLSIQLKAHASMNQCKLGLWLETTLAWLFRSQMKNFCLQELNLEIFAVSKLRIRCLSLLNQFVLRVSKLFKQLLLIRFVSEEVMDRSYYSMLTKISVNLWCNANFMEVFKASVQAQMEYKCLQQLVKDSFIDWE